MKSAIEKGFLGLFAFVRALLESLGHFIERARQLSKLALGVGKFRAAGEVAIGEFAGGCIKRPHLAQHEMLAAEPRRSERAQTHEKCSPLSKIREVNQHQDGRDGEQNRRHQTHSQTGKMCHLQRRLFAL